MVILKWWLIKGGRALSLLDSEAGFRGGRLQTHGENLSL